METFVGSGNIPYAAIRESYVKARELLSNLNGEFSNGVHGQDQGETENGAEEVERKDQENDLEDDESSRQSALATGDEEEEEDEVEDDHNYVDSVESFWRKALATKCFDFPVTYEVREGRVSCSIGQLRVEGEGRSEEEAKQRAAAAMLNKIENILEEHRDIVQIIKTGHETKQVSVNPPFRDETIFSEEDEDDQGTKGNAYQEEEEEERGGSSEVVSAPATKTADSEPLETEMMPGAEYCLGLLRTDKPGESNYQFVSPQLLNLYRSESSS